MILSSAAIIIRLHEHSELVGSDAPNGWGWEVLGCFPRGLHLPSLAGQAPATSASTISVSNTVTPSVPDTTL